MQGGGRQAKAGCRTQGTWPDGVIAASLGGGGAEGAWKGVGTVRERLGTYSGLGNVSQLGRSALKCEARTSRARFSRVSPRRRNSVSESRCNCSYMVAAA
jgi:hypothetical protein